MKRCKTFLCALTVALSGIFSYSNVKAEEVTSVPATKSHDVLANVIGSGDVISVRIIWGDMQFTYNTGTWVPDDHEYVDVGLPQGHVNASIYDDEESEESQYKGWSAKEPTTDPNASMTQSQYQDDEYLKNLLQGNEIVIINDSNVHIAVNPEFTLNSSQGGYIESKFKAKGYNYAEHDAHIVQGVLEDTDDDVYLLPSAVGREEMPGSQVDYKLCLSGAPDVAGLQTDGGKIGEINITLSERDIMPPQQQPIGPMQPW